MYFKGRIAIIKTFHVGKTLAVQTDVLPSLDQCNFKIGPMFAGKYDQHHLSHRPSVYGTSETNPVMSNLANIVQCWYLNSVIVADVGATFG